MVHARFTIRYRLPGPAPALLVVEETGDLFTINPNGVPAHLAKDGAFPGLDLRLRRLGWIPVPTVSPFTLDELRRVLGPIAA